MLIESYIEEINKRIKDKRVLDIGCCASTSKNLLKRHRLYEKSAKEIVGIDYNKDLIKEAKDRLGYKLYYCDLTNRHDVENIIKSFGRFQNIICTDVIEHISNLGLFLDNIKLMLEDKGTLYLTTPNMRSPRWMQMCITNTYKVNADHICWFDVFTLGNLLKRSNLKIVKTMYQAQETKAITFFKFKPQDWMSRRILVLVEKE
ncbi:MAG: class I SAM-dependent methyltransferase [Vallitaleaceae bacterium]|nr:class I SAM-dependent methyltransferase [Vallitaleaceae bacterium]